jgi:hypothetical protein
LETQDHEIRHVRQYFESQTPSDNDERIQHIEKVASERVVGRDHDVYDVHTNLGRWWVITNPTNLYSHADHPSLDQALTLHLGVALRVAEKSRHDEATDEERDRFARTWRRFEGAVDTFNRATEAEEFQTVGAQCRQCLLAFIAELEAARFLPTDERADEPKRNDFKAWIGMVARGIARNDRVRSYLGAVARETWDMVAWLVHFEDAVAYDAELVLDATSNTIHAFGTALLRWENRPPDRCPQCESYRMVTDYRPELDDPPYVVLCEACGWEEKVRPWCSDDARDAARAVGVEPLEEGFGSPPFIPRTPSASGSG